MNETVEFSQTAQHGDYKEIDYTANDFCLAGFIIVMLESDMCACRGLSHVIWGDMCSIVFEDQEIVLANEKAFKLTCSLSINLHQQKQAELDAPPFCSSTKEIITFMWASTHTLG